MKNVNQPVLLITDDDRSFRETIADIFRDRGFRPLLASDGDEAIHLAQEKTVHVALFDFHMPQLTGLESITVCRELGLDIPYILMTGDLDSQIASDAQQVRVFSLLTKPISVKQVTKTVSTAMSRHYDWYRED